MFFFAAGDLRLNTSILRNTPSSSDKIHQLYNYLKDD